MQHQSNIQKHQQSQTLRILPQQIQFLNLLHLNALELDNYLQNELDENPFLETNTEAEPATELYEQPGNDEQHEEDDFDNPLEMRGLDDEIPDYNTKVENGYDTGDAYQAPAVQLTNIREELKNQCRFFNVDERMETLCNYIIDSLDDSGFLPTGLDLLADDISFSKNVFFADEEMETALQWVQQMDPPGIGARNLRECLLLQLNRQKDQGFRVDLPIILVSDYLDLLAGHDYHQIMEALQIGQEDLQYALEYIKTLNPRPLQGASDESTIGPGGIMPEYLIEIDGTDILVTLANGRAETLKLSDDVGELMKKTNDKKAEQFIRKKMEDANWIIEALRQRDDTMLRVIRVLAVLQRDFFLSGDIKDLKPMILRDVADYTGMDISTVSRVTSTKYVQTPFGIFLLKNLFVHTFMAQDGHKINNADVQECLLEIIGGEDKSDPLNDTVLCELLTNRGFPVARRTVAKYREMLNIPVAALRRTV